MKIISLLLSLCLASVALAEEPAELERLRHLWEQSVAKEVDEKNKIYLKSLEKLQKKFTGANNLAAAVAVNDEMQKVKAIKPQENLFNPPNGEWKVIYNNGARRTYLIKGNEITVVNSSIRGVGQTVKLTKYAQGWLAKFVEQTEYIFPLEDKIFIHHWGGSTRMNYKTGVPPNIAMGIQE